MFKIGDIVSAAVEIVEGGTIVAGNPEAEYVIDGVPQLAFIHANKFDFGLVNKVRHDTVVVSFDRTGIETVVLRNELIHPASA